MKKFKFILIIITGLFFCAKNLLAQKPIAGFGADKTITCDGVINFSDSSLYSPDSWYWNFGDGVIDSIKNPTHTYSSNGTYTVTLIAQNSLGSDTTTKTNYVSVTLGAGPIASSCTPYTINYCCGMGIYKVTFGSIINATSDGIDGYKDYSCFLKNIITQGVPTDISIQTGPSYNENVVVWIDYNNDGNFNNLTELVFFSNSTLQYHAGKITAPSSAVYNTTLRMRVASDYYPYVPQPCINSYYGQFEDYSVTVLPNTNPPKADFTADYTTTCNGKINFTDLSYNNPVSWKWNFGDGTTSILQNPSHTYSTADTFNVTLIVTNSYGKDTLKKNKYIKVISINGPQSISCYPKTSYPNPAYGIFEVTLNSINKISSLGDGYKDFTCTDQTTLTAGFPNDISIITGFQNFDNQNVRVWIDYNNDGVLNDTTELAFASDNILTYHSGKIIVPGNAIKNTALRMRVSTDVYWQAPPKPCADLYYGQAEDYSITILSNSNPPVSRFGSDPLITCTGTVNFSDSSYNLPTSWFWKFGDGQTSTLQNPIHTYLTADSFDVTLIVSNAFGSDTLKKNNFIKNTPGASPINPSCIPNSLYHDVDYGIFNVTIGSINNTTSANNYRDYSCSNQTTLVAEIPYSISVKTGTQTSENVSVWIDYNNDGIFNDTIELAFQSLNKLTNHSGTIKIPNSAFKNTILRMRVASDASWNDIIPCQIYYGDFEDYGVKILPNNNKPVAKFGADKLLSCDGVISFIDSSVNVITSRLWKFGDGSTSTLKNPVHTYSSSGKYNVSLVITGPSGKDSVIKSNYINITLGAGPLVTSCIPLSTFSGTYDMEIHNVTISNIDNSSLQNNLPYEEFTCSHQIKIVATKSTPISIRTGPLYQENVRVWIDYNNDGIFTEPSELAFSSDNNLVHKGNINIPNTAVKLTPIRMRVAADYWGSAPPPPCADLDYGQAEDYTVYVYPSTTKPDADFTYTVTNSCKGIVEFTDKSLFIPNSWSWDFGDGIGKLTTKNPTYTYNSPGTYNVRFIAINSNGSDTLTKTITIQSLKVQFGMSGNLIHKGDTVSFKDSSLTANKWLWNFSDGGTDSVKNPKHIFNIPGTYNVILTATNSNTGCTGNNDKPMQIVVLYPIAINEIGNDFMISIYPNPVSDNLNLLCVFNEQKDFSLSIFNILGKEIYSEKVNNLSSYQKSINLSLQPKGIYFVRINEGEKTIVKKIILQ